MRLFYLAVLMLVASAQPSFSQMPDEPPRPMPDEPPGALLPSGLAPVGAPRGLHPQPIAPKVAPRGLHPQEIVPQAPRSSPKPMLKEDRDPSGRDMVDEPPPVLTPNTLGVPAPNQIQMPAEPPPPPPPPAPPTE